MELGNMINSAGITHPDNANNPSAPDGWHPKDDMHDLDVAVRKARKPKLKGKARWRKTSVYEMDRAVTKPGKVKHISPSEYAAMMAK